MTRRIARGVFPLMLLLCIAGCGSAAKVDTATYGTELRAATAPLAKLTSDLDAATKAQTSQERITRLRSVQHALRESGNALNDLQAPSKLEKPHAQLVSGVRDMADAIDDLVEAERLADVDPNRAKVLLRRFASDDSLPRVQAAAAKITKAGVDAGF